MVCEKSPAFVPVMFTALTLRTVFRWFVKVVVNGLLAVPTVTEPKLRLVGLNETGRIPVPFTVIVCGLFGALSVIVTVPDCAPVAVGENVMLILQVAPAAILVPQVFTWLKGAAVAMLMLVSATLWLLVRMTEAAVRLVPNGTLPKLTLAVDSVTATTPVPVTLIVWGLLPASSVAVKIAERAPVAVGAKATLILQDCPAARLDPQVFVCEKSPGFVPVNPILLMFSVVF